MKFEHVTDLWDDKIADSLDAVGRLVYRSNLLGQDWRITNTGGGNTSSKLMELDPITGEQVEVLWVKGSGGDLRTSKQVNFSSLYQEKLLALIEMYAQMSPRGPKTTAEDKMVAMYKHCTFNLNPRAPSIDTPLHSFIPHKIVDHTHPVSCISIATSKNGKAITKEIYGDRVIWVDWLRPGFELGLQMKAVCEQNPQAVGIMMGGHGLINWAETDKECYHLSLSLIDQAASYIAQFEKGEKTFGGQKYTSLPEEGKTSVLTAVLPWLRGQVSDEKNFIGTIQTDENTLEFINSQDAPRLAELGTSCPDHFLRTKIKPLYVNWDAQNETVEELKDKLAQGLVDYSKDYQSYYETHKHDDSPAMRPSFPTVMLIPGIGMVTWGKNKSESRVVAEFYNAAIGVMRGAEAISSYTAIARQEAFDIEYWLLEEAKLKRMPAEAELSRKIIAIFGAGSGIGKATAKRLIKEGAIVVVLDLSEENAKNTAQEIMDEIGMGIGVAGTGISGCGDTIGIGCDITNRTSIKEALNTISLAYGGLDSVIITAGLYATAPFGETDSVWEKSFKVNTIGPALVAEEASQLWNEQGLPASMVLTTSVNGVVSKQGSMAYDTSKAASNHLVRELAVSLAPTVRVNGIAPATVVDGSSMFPRERVITSLEKYHILYSINETTENLRDKLANFYAQRTLTKAPISTEDQAEAIFLLVSNRLSKTTGQIISVDGGLVDAFLR